MSELKREYQDGRIEIIVWRDGDSYLVTFNSTDSSTNAHVFAKIQETPGSEVLGVFSGVNELGVEAVRDRLFENLLHGRTRPITSSELQKLLFK